jgi:response regulator RpfG family c-di-GMP phosphodiesterase
MKKVYIIDDDRDMVEAMSIILTKNNYQVFAQYDDEHIEEKVREAMPDVIILDVMFPEDSSAGFGIARILKGAPDLARIPIIMLSAINEQGIYLGRFSNRDIDEAWLPVNMFVEKPVSAKALIEKVEALIGKGD